MRWFKSVVDEEGEDKRTNQKEMSRILVDCITCKTNKHTTDRRGWFYIRGIPVPKEDKTSTDVGVTDLPTSYVWLWSYIYSKKRNQEILKSKFTYTSLGTQGPYLTVTSTTYYKK